MRAGRIGSIFLGVVFVTALVGCGDSGVEGDGEVVTEVRSVEAFTALRVSTAPRCGSLSTHP